MKFKQEGENEELSIEMLNQGKDVFMMAGKELGAKKILEQFTPEQQSLIIERFKVLSIIPKIIGKDFDMPVELNKAGGGWHWDFKANIVRVDPVDLLEKPIDYLRFVMAHEGGHRRISRTDFIPLEVWKQKGFSFLMNVIEDPRDNNFLADTYPRFREEAKVAYDINNALAEKMKTEAKDRLGMVPRFELAGHEFIRLWYSWFKREKMIIDDRLPTEVQNVVRKALVSAEDAWSRYPNQEETEGEKGQETIRAFAKVSYDIILEEIWPEFQKLVQADLEDQKLEEYLKQLEKEKQDKIEGNQDGNGEEGQSSSGTDSSESDLTEEQQEELEKALEKAIEDAIKEDNQENEEGESGDGKKSEESHKKLGKELDDQKYDKGRPIPLDSLSSELKEKLKKKIDSLSEEEKKKLAEKAEQALSEFERSLNKEIEGKISENPEQKAKREEGEKVEGQEENSKEIDKEGESRKKAERMKESEEEQKQEKVWEEKRQKEIDELRSELEKITQGDKTIYENNRREVQPIINSLTSELRNIFRKRRENKYLAGRKSGRHIDIATRIKEIAKGVNPFDSRAWMRKEAPQEKDYAFTLLVDLSGSMRGEKIEETFKAVIVLTEVLTQLGIKTEILGFNNRIHEFLVFGKKLSKDVRDKMSEMLGEVASNRALYNDDGWAVDEASKRLAMQDEIEKIMIVLSDGVPEESSVHSGEEYELKSVVDKIVLKDKVKVIGLGIGSGTSHVSHYYPYSIADVSVGEMAKQLADLLVKVIEGNNKF